MGAITINFTSHTLGLKYILTQVNPKSNNLSLVQKKYIYIFNINTTPIVQF